MLELFQITGQFCMNVVSGATNDSCGFQWESNLGQMGNFCASIHHKQSSLGVVHSRMRACVSICVFGGLVNTIFHKPLGGISSNL